MTKIYCTKWAVIPKVFTENWRRSHGIVEFEIGKEVSHGIPIRVFDSRWGWATLRLGKNAFLTRKEAEQDVIKKAQAHIRVLKIRLERLERLREELLAPIKETMERIQESLKP